jgi:hypothetical protein
MYYDVSVQTALVVGPPQGSDAVDGLGCLAIGLADTPCSRISLK